MTTISRIIIDDGRENIAQADQIEDQGALDDVLSTKLPMVSSRQILFFDVVDPK